MSAGFQMDVTHIALMIAGGKQRIPMKRGNHGTPVLCTMPVLDPCPALRMRRRRKNFYRICGSTSVQPATATIAGPERYG
jgi:hypothetical protein